MSITEDAAIAIDYTRIRGAHLYPPDINKPTCNDQSQVSELMTSQHMLRPSTLITAWASGIPLTCTCVNGAGLPRGKDPPQLERVGGRAFQWPRPRWPTVRKEERPHMYKQAGTISRRVVVRRVLESMLTCSVLNDPNGATCSGTPFPSSPYHPSRSTHTPFTTPSLIECFQILACPLTWSHHY